MSASWLERVDLWVVGRSGREELTVFKSVGSALVDLLAAQFAYERFSAGTR